MRRMELRAAVAVLILSFSAALLSAEDWNVGDVFAGVSGGDYNVYDNDGIYKETINNGWTGFTTGCAFNSDFSRLFTTAFSEAFVVVFDDAHPHNIVYASDTAGFGGGSPESIAFDSSGSFYVGHANGDRDIQRYLETDGSFLDKFDVATEIRGSDWIDLSADQETIFYTSEGSLVKTYNVLTGVQGPDFSSALSGPAYALRLLEGGGALVADTSSIKRLNSAGVVLQTYDVQGEDTWFALNLDPNGTSFWSGNFGTDNFYRFSIDTGAVEVGPISAGSGGNLFGLCVKGELTVATVIRVDMDIKFCSNPNAHNCRSGGVLPLTVFGTETFDVRSIDLTTAQLCLATDDTTCVGPPKNWQVEDRGDPTTDLGASMCAVDEVTGEELNALNPDGFDDIDIRFVKKDVTEFLLDDCGVLHKGDVSPTLVFKAKTLDGVAISSVPVDDVGIDQLLRQN